MTKPRRKLIFLWTYLNWGGAQIYFMAIMKEAVKESKSWDVVAVLPRQSSPEMIGFLEQIGVAIEFLDVQLDLDPAETLPRKIQRQWSRVRAELATLRYLRRYKLSDAILHVETSPWQSWQFLTLLSMLRANVFVTMHNAIYSKSRWRELVWKARMQFVSRLPGFHIFASNKDTKDKIRHLVEASFWGRIPVTYTCVDPLQIKSVLEDREPRNERRSRHGIVEDDFIVLCVGQFIDRKGRWIFLEAAKILQQSLPEIKFVWVAPQQPDAEDKKRIDELRLDNFRLILSSKIGSNRTDVLTFFCIADLFALPSYVEGLPIALLEAMALGIASISTNVYAIPEAVQHGETGFLIEPGKADQLAAAIIELKNHQGLRQKLAKQGSDYVLANFDERVAARRAISEYEKCFE